MFPAVIRSAIQVSFQLFVFLCKFTLPFLKIKYNTQAKAGNAVQPPAVFVYYTEHPPPTVAIAAAAEQAADLIFVPVLQNNPLANLFLLLLVADRERPGKDGRVSGLHDTQYMHHRFL